MIGARIDPDFGPVVVVGDGGKYVEALHDFALLVTPFDEDGIEGSACAAFASRRSWTACAAIRRSTSTRSPRRRWRGEDHRSGARRHRLDRREPGDGGRRGEGVAIADALVERGAAP